MVDFKQKYWKWVILIGCGVYCFFEAAGKDDFYIFLSAADDLKAPINVFEKTYVDGYHYYYSVFFALLLKPFVSLPYSTLKFCWLFFNCLLFINLLQILFKSDLVKKLPVQKQSLFVILVFISSLQFFTENINSSQITILILWCCIKGLMLIENQKLVAGAAILALGINIKLLPLVLIPYLFYRGYFKAVVYTICFYFGMMFLPSFIIGYEYNMQLLSTWLSLINPLNKAHVLDVAERSFHGLSTLLSTLFVENIPDEYALKLKRNIADVNLETLSKIILGARLFLISLTLYFLKFNFFKKAKSNLSLCLEVSYILLLIPLIFPHQQHYAFLFAIPAFSLILYFIFLNNAHSNKVIIGLTILIYLIFNLKLLLGVFNSYYEHYKIITYAALLIIPILIYISRRKLFFSGQ